MLNELLLAAALHLHDDPIKPVYLSKDRATELTAPMVSSVKKGVSWLSPEQAGLLLVTIGAYESDFQRSLETCEETGDGGRAISCFQVQFWGRYSREQVCSSHAIATKVATDHLWRAASMCDLNDNDKTIECVITKYWSAAAKKTWLGVQKRAATYHRLARLVGMEGAES